jgi:REP element-mobilizing transposase RayT
MARIPRHEIIDESEVGTYHCVQRCVRRAFLCGKDAVTGRNYDHRKEWIRRRLEFLAANFAIDILGYTAMSNHLHVVLRNRPDLVAAWSDEEVARRWWNLFPGRKDDKGRPAEPEEYELAMLTADADALAEMRRRLSSLSWLMRCLAEPIARRANREDGCTGRFWEGRYKCQRLLDEAALLACSVYVDLNPIRAGVAATPETSRFTGAYDRIHASAARKRTKRRRMKQSGRSRSKSVGAAARVSRHGDAWLSPVHLNERRQVADGKPTRRASNKGFLPLKWHEYLRLLDWTGRQARQDKQGSIPSDLAPILERLSIVEGRWLDTVLNFGRWLHRAAGRKESLAAEAARRGRQWLAGTSHSRAAFA